MKFGTYAYDSLTTTITTSSICTVTVNIFVNRNLFNIMLCTELEFLF